MAQDVNQSEMDVATQVRLALVARISHERYELWMPEEARWEWSESTLTITMPHDFARQIAKRMLSDELREALNQTVGSQANILWSVAEADAAAEVTELVVVSAHGVAVPDHQSSVVSVGSAEEDVPGAPMLAGSIGLHPPTVDAAPVRSLALSNSALGTAGTNSRSLGCTVSAGTQSEEENYARVKTDLWAEFVAGSSNQMAWTTVNMIANEPGSMTPALLHGPCGVGKSHLAAALAQRLRMQRRQRRVVHVSAEQFTNDFTEALRGGGLPMLRRKYRDVDTLILDDLQFLLNKKATVGELRFTLDNLLKGGKQILLLADRPLSDLEGLGSDFLGRVRGGLIAPILPLDEETRFQILRRDLKLCEVSLSDDIAMQIAARAIGDGRLLKGIVKRLMATSYLNDAPLTWDECWNAIYDLIQATQPIVRLGDIERVVCEVFGLEPESLQSDRKTRQVSQPRMLAMFLARKYTPAAYQEIGQYFGNRRHSTVISAEKTVGGWLEDNTSLQLPRGRLSIREAIRHVEANLHVG